MKLTQPADPVTIVSIQPHRPLHFRLPRPGENAPNFGLSRSGWNKLEARGLIRFRRLTHDGLDRGTTLVKLADAEQPFDALDAAGDNATRTRGFSLR